MSATVHHSGTYRFIPAINAYSSGIAAEPGFAVEGVQFAKPTRLAAALRMLDTEIERRGLAPTALAGLHLRSPAVLTVDSFGSFNNSYLSLLDDRGLLVDGSSPLSRTNVVPLGAPPTETAVHTAYLVVPVAEAGGEGGFVIAGSGEASGGLGPDHIVAFRDTSPDGLRAKRDMVIGVLRKRLATLGFGPDAPVTVNVYTAHDIPELASSLSSGLPGTARFGHVMYASRPPVDDIEFEMDCLRVRQWRLI